MRIVTAALLGSVSPHRKLRQLRRTRAILARSKTIPGAEHADAARGTVFLDENRNSVLDEGEAGVPGVLVSNGREVVATSEDGGYELPAYDDMNLFITKPAGHSTPISEEMVPRFYYLHKIEGSPPLRLGGIEPTGPLPEAINFPLIEDGVRRPSSNA